MGVNGNRLTIVIETHPRLVPATTDPHEVAEDIVAEYNERCVANGLEPIEFIGAEWGHHLEIPS